MNIWRTINEGRCAHLGDTIKDRCRKKGRWRGPIFVDRTTAGGAYWIVADLCNEHAALFPGINNVPKQEAAIRSALEASTQDAPE